MKISAVVVSDVQVSVRNEVSSFSFNLMFGRKALRSPFSAQSGHTTAHKFYVKC